MLRKQILLLGNKKCFCLESKTFLLLRPKHMFPSLATPGNITRNIVSATMFPSLARPLRRSSCLRYFSFRDSTNVSGVSH